MCPTCHDLGWTHLDVMPGHPDFGRAVRCNCQAERDRARAAQKARAASNLTEALAALTFENFTQRQEVVNLTAAYGELERFCREVTGWVALVGGPGLGKTHLLAATANRLMRTNRAHPLYVIVPDFLDYLRDGFSDDAIDADQSERMEQAIHAEVLLLDDLGSEKRSPWTDERLYRVLNNRYKDRRPTVISSNVALPRLEERIADRMQDVGLSRCIALSGPSYRGSKGQMAKAKAKGR